MARVFEVAYKVDVKDKLTKKENELRREHGRFWGHAVNEPIFAYKLDVGDMKKAKAVAKILKLIQGKSSMRRLKYKVVGVKNNGQ